MGARAPSGSPEGFAYEQALCGYPCMQVNSDLSHADTSTCRTKSG